MPITEELRTPLSAEATRALKLMVVLARANAAVERTLAADMAGHGLTATEFGVLEALYHKGPMLLGEVQRRILISSGGITYTVDRLADKGLVERRDCPTDRRARYAALTPAGEQLMDTIFPAHAAVIEKAMAGLSPAEQEVATGLLRKLGLAAQQAADAGQGGATG